MPATARSSAYKSSQARESAAVRSERKNLRSDMRADSLPVNEARIAVLEVQAARSFPIDSKFVAMVSGGNMRMAACLDVRIDANGSSGAHAQPGRLRSQQIKFRSRLYVEEKNARAQRFANFLPGFSHAGKNNAVSEYADAPQAIQFAAGNNVKSAAQRGEYAQNAQSRISFCGVTNRVRQRAKCRVHPAVRLLDAGAAVQVRRCAVFPGDGCDGHALAIQLRSAI